ncbi:MAG: hypothetical protein AAGC96_19035 [Pseudomonadota bacterium]
MSKFLYLVACLAFAGVLLSGARAAELAVLAQPGPWPVADHLIAYRGQIWFSTAVKGVDHNSADVWRFDPETQTASFERYLFSQDTGRPAVHEGLLFWPHEDMRVGLGAGVTSVTNGTEWRDLFVPSTDHMMHTHALVPWRGGLVAAMAGWNSVLARSDDAGQSWQILANDPPQSGSFHRYNDVAVLGDRLFVRHWQNTGLTLAEYRDGQVVPVEDWAQGHYFTALTPFAGALYALVDDQDGARQLWRIADDGPRRVETAPKDLNANFLFHDGETLWAMVRDKDGGQLWSSKDGSTFVAGDRVRGGVPTSAAALGPGRIYIGGAGIDGKAILWGPTDGTPVVQGEAAALPDQGNLVEWPFDVEADRARLLAALGDVKNYQGHGRPLRDLLSEVTVSKPPPGFLASLLQADMPAGEVEVFGGRFSVAARDIATWHILAAMARVGDPTVPVAVLSADWTREANRPQKWFDALLIGLHAVQLSGQNDRPTVEALIGRLDRPNDPDWLLSQVTGTLSAVTGMPFAYDKTAWKEWWESAQKTWPSDAS